MVFMNLRCLGKKSNQKTKIRNMPPRSFRVAARIWLLIIFIKLRHLLTSFLGFWPPTTRLPTDWVLLNRKSFGWRCGGFAKTAGVRRIEFGSFVLAWFFWLLFLSRKKVTRVYGWKNLISTFVRFLVISLKSLQIKLLHFSKNLL